MKRDTFIKTSSIGTLGLISMQFSSFKQSTKSEKITILHTNDTHSNIDAFPTNHPKNPNQGGVSKRFEIIENIRKECEHVLLLDAGDIFQGTPYFNKYGGVLEMKVMSEMGYDLATMGNHDFDGSMEGFLRAKQHSSFPFVCSNYDFSKTVLEGHTLQRKIFQKGKIKIGIFGLGVELKGLVPANLYKETNYLDPIEIAQQETELLKKEKCDYIICLSHLGYQYADENKISDRKLAQKTRNIDLIIGGHTHTFLEKPTQEYNLDGKITLINQVGWAGLQLGRIDIEFGKQLKNKSKTLVIE
jgi:5'-nucleotidase